GHAVGRPGGRANLGGIIRERAEILARERGGADELRAHELHAVAGVPGEAHDDGIRFEEVVIDHSVLGQVQTRRWSEISAWRINKAAILHYTARGVHQTAQPAVLSGPDRGSLERVPAVLAESPPAHGRKAWAAAPGVTEIGGDYSRTAHRRSGRERICIFRINR